MPNFILFLRTHTCRVELDTSEGSLLHFIFGRPDVQCFTFAASANEAIAVLNVHSIYCVGFEAVLDNFSAPCSLLRVEVRSRDEDPEVQEPGTPEGSCVYPSNSHRCRSLRNLLEISRSPKSYKRIPKGQDLWEGCKRFSVFDDPRYRTSM